MHLFGQLRMNEMYDNAINKRDMIFKDVINITAIL